ncbi:MAG TPA: hypothetical protein VG755_00305, partial [Nannocystaceae bacterium]|nr:hypothetical protein [Nannocystaceae bacterium]
MLSGRTRAGSFGWLGCALALRGDGRSLLVRPGRLWWFGSADLDRTALWLSLARALDPRRRSEAIEIRLDLAMEALRVPFVQAGWKIPALEQLELRVLSVDAQRARAQWEGASSPIEVALGGSVERDPIVAATEHVRTSDDVATAIDELALAVAAAPLAAQVAVQRWGVELFARNDPARRAACARAWLRLRPADGRAQRELIAALRAAPDHDELQRHLHAWSRLAVSGRRRTRNELAIAHACVEIGDFAGARARVEPLLGHEDTELAPAIARAWVLAQLDQPIDAMATLDRDELLSPREKSELWSELARVLSKRGDDERAWLTMSRAAETGGADENWIALAHVLLERGTPDRSALDLVERTALAGGDTRLQLRLASVAERDGRNEEAARHWLAVADAESTTPGRLAALRRWLHVRGVETHGYAAVVAAAARPDVVAIFARIAALAPDHAEAGLVLGEAAALAGDEVHSAELDDRTVVARASDPRAAGALVRMLERADADRDDDNIRELLADIARIPIDDHGLRARIDSVRRRLLAADPRARAAFVIAGVRGLGRPEAIATLRDAAARESDIAAFVELGDALVSLGGRT